MRSNGIQLRIGDMFYAIKKRWTMIVFLTLIGLGFGILMSGVSYLQGTMSRNYEISASVVIIAQKADGTFSDNNRAPEISDIRMAQEMAESATYILSSDRLINVAIERMNLIGISAKDIADNLTVTQYEDTPVVELALTWRSAEEGTEILNAILTAADRVLQDTLRTGAVSVIDEPTAKWLVGGAMNVPIWGIMMVLGFAAGLGIAVLDLLMRPTLLNIKDVQTNLGLETLGVIPRNDAYFRKKRSLLEEAQDGITTLIEQRYSAAAYIIKNRLGGKEQHHAFYITSTDYGEGKSTVAANLAIQLSDMEQKVLLIDFDMRNPGLGGLFLERVDYDHSLNALYKGEINELEAITTLTGYLDLLPSVLERNPIPIDGSVVDMVAKLKEKYNYIIMDAPPVGQMSDALSLNTLVDTSILVIGYDHASQNDIQETIDRMDKSGISILGCIVNRERSVHSRSLFDNDTENRAKVKERKIRRGADAARFEAPEKSAAEEMMSGRNTKKRKSKAEIKAERAAAKVAAARAESEAYDRSRQKQKKKKKGAAEAAEPAGERIDPSETMQTTDMTADAVRFPQNAELPVSEAPKAQEEQNAPAVSSDAPVGMTADSASGIETKQETETQADSIRESSVRESAAASRERRSDSRAAERTAADSRSIRRRSIFEEVDFDVRDSADSLSDDDVVDALIKRGLSTMWGADDE